MRTFFGQSVCGLVLSVLCLALTPAGSLHAQRTWIVDSQNRPGTDFTDLQVAVDTVPPGDTLVIRLGVVLYPAPTIRKGIHLVTQRGYAGFLSGALRISGVPVGQCLSIRSFHLASSPSEVIIENCSGQVVLDDCIIDSWLPFPTRNSLTITNCRQVSLNWVNAHRGFITDSKVMCQGGGFGNPLDYPYALTLLRSDLTLANAAVIGSPPSYERQACHIVYRQPGPAMHATDSTITLTGRGGIVGGILVCGSQRTEASAIDGARFVVRQDPNSLLGIIRTSEWTRVQISMPVVNGYHVNGDNMFFIRAYTEPNAWMALAASLPFATPTQVPPFGELWLDPSTWILAKFENLGATGYGEYSIPAPVHYPIGWPVVFQAFVFQNNQYSLSSPAVFVKGF